MGLQCVYSSMSNVYMPTDTQIDGPLDVAENGEGENPRRSSSMDCLSDPDLWPRSLSSTNQVRDV